MSITYNNNDETHLIFNVFSFRHFSHFAHAVLQNYVHMIPHACLIREKLHIGLEAQLEHQAHSYHYQSIPHTNELYTHTCHNIIIARLIPIMV